MRKLLCIVPIILLSCTNKNKAQQAINTTVPVEHITPTADQAERRAKSEAYCNAHGVPIYTNPNALFPEAESGVNIRSQDSVVSRALALLYIGLKSEGMPQKQLDEINKEWDILSKLSPKESAYATAAQPTEQQKIDANWRYEGLHIMLWALGFVDSLSYPDKMCNVVADAKIIHDLTPEKFRQQARLRSKKEILDQADLILRLDWACVSARVKEKSAPGKLDAGVVYERHYALNWLINYADLDWDEVTTDT